MLHLISVATLGFAGPPAAPVRWENCFLGSVPKFRSLGGVRLRFTNCRVKILQPPAQAPTQAESSLGGESCPWPVPETHPRLSTVAVGVSLGTVCVDFQTTLHRNPHLRTVLLKLVSTEKPSEVCESRSQCRILAKILSCLVTDSVRNADCTTVIRAQLLERWALAARDMQVAHSWCHDFREAPEEQELDKCLYEGEFVSSSSAPTRPD